MKLSIVTAVYNGSAHIRETIESVLRQQDLDYEYIIIDGGSNDDTLKIIESYLPAFQGRMRYLSEPDNGVYDAMNKGIRLCTGDYIGLINSDDRYKMGAFNAVRSLILQHSECPDVVYSDLDVVDEAGDIVGGYEGDASKLKKGMTVNHPTCFVKRSVYETMGLYDTKYQIVADYDFMLRIFHRGANFCKSSSKIAEYRMGGLSTNNYKSVQERYLIQRMYYGLLYCSYVKARGLFRCKIKAPILALFKGNKK